MGKKLLKSVSSLIKSVLAMLAEFGSAASYAMRS